MVMVCGERCRRGPGDASSVMGSLLWPCTLRPTKLDKKGYFHLFAMHLGEIQLLITRRLEWRTRLPTEVTNLDWSDAVAMATLVSWETPKGCHGILSPIPLGRRRSCKNPSRWFQPCHPAGHCLCTSQGTRPCIPIRLLHPLLHRVPMNQTPTCRQ